MERTIMMERPIIKTPGVEIPLEEYRALVELQGRVKVLEAFIKKSSYGIQREDCAAILNLDLKRESEEERNHGI